MGARLAKLAVTRSAGNNMTYKLDIKQKTIKRIIELRSMRDNRLSVKAIECKVGKEFHISHSTIRNWIYNEHITIQKRKREGKISVDDFKEFFYKNIFEKRENIASNFGVSVLLIAKMIYNEMKTEDYMTYKLELRRKAVDMANELIKNRGEDLKISVIEANVASAFGVSPSIIRDWLIREHDGNLAAQKRKNRIDLNEFIAYFNSLPVSKKVNRKKIAEHFDISIPAVQGRLKKMRALQ